MTAPLEAVPAQPPVEEPVRVGRPRDPSRDAALVEATLGLLAEIGYGRLTMEAVAARAGVGKATLYRRWSSKEQLVVDALASLIEPVEDLTEAGVRDQLVALLDATRRRHASQAGQIFPRLIGEAPDQPELMQRYRTQVLEPRRQRFRTVLQAGVEQGLVRPDADLDHVIDLLVGPLAYRTLIRTEPPPPADLSARIVDDVLRAMAPQQETS